MDQKNGDRERGNRDIQTYITELLEVSSQNQLITGVTTRFSSRFQVKQDTFASIEPVVEARFSILSSRPKLPRLTGLGVQDLRGQLQLRGTEQSRERKMPFVL